LASSNSKNSSNPSVIQHPALPLLPPPPPPYRILQFNQQQQQASATGRRFWDIPPSAPKCLLIVRRRSHLHSKRIRITPLFSSIELHTHNNKNKQQLLLISCL
jgi:hypothetical protein